MNPVLYNFEDGHPMFANLCEKLGATPGALNYRAFPDGESYLRVDDEVKGKKVVILADLSQPNSKCLPLFFLARTLEELGAAQVGLIAPYLCYMRQDLRFQAGEALTSKLFAELVSSHFSWLVTVDPHLHRYDSLSEIYSIPSTTIHAASNLAQWIKAKYPDAFLVGPDEESEQWVRDIAQQAVLPYVIGNKKRFGDRSVEVGFPSLKFFRRSPAVIVDDVISSGHTLLRSMSKLKHNGIETVHCVAIHGLFADGIDNLLASQGLGDLVTSNTVPHPSNQIDLHENIANAVTLHLFGKDYEKGRKSEVA